MKIQKTGRNFNRKLKFDKINLHTETIDKYNLKSVFIVINGWFNVESTFYELLNKRLKSYIVKNINKEFFYTDRIIGYYDVPKYESENEYKYMQYEFTVFTKPHLNIELAEKLLYDFTIELYNEFFESPQFDVKRQNPKKYQN